ncbi:MAG: RidA family protein [Lacisediminimonas sp.]|nr:RidA family protein [Lacisediminimonas sp.]
MTSQTPPWPFPPARKINTTVYLGLQVTAPTPAAAAAATEQIESETHQVFQSLIQAIESQDLTMQDLMKLHTYYPYDGDGREVTEYWERMTKVRLQYLANPGPAATALRVTGIWPKSPLIGIDGIADNSKKRQRIMPAHAWDWSVPTPFSQGWLVDDKVYVGGQISADRRGRAVAPGELAPQVGNTLEFIRHVLKDADAAWDDVVSIKVAYKCSQNDATSRNTLAQIIDEMNRVFPQSKPALVCFGVDLLYEGLLLEIDALAVKGRKKAIVNAADGAAWNGSANGYPAAWLAGNELFIGGQSAPAAGSLQAQTTACIQQIDSLLQQAGGNIGDLVKLNVYYHDDAADADAGIGFGIVRDTLACMLQAGRTVVSLVEVPGLMTPGQKVQLDGIAVLNQA